jgi:hypothetical protein
MPSAPFYIRFPPGVLQCPCDQCIKLLLQPALHCFCGQCTFQPYRLASAGKLITKEYLCSIALHLLTFTTCAALSLSPMHSPSLQAGRWWQALNH